MSARSSDNEISRILSVMSEPTRIRIIRLISGSGELRSCDLLPEFEITQPTLSHHLNVLLENDVLTSRKAGRCVYFSVNKTTMSLVAGHMVIGDDHAVRGDEESRSHPFLNKLGMADLIIRYNDHGGERLLRHAGVSRLQIVNLPAHESKAHRQGDGDGPKAYENESLQGASKIHFVNAFRCFSQ